LNEAIDRLQAEFIRAGRGHEFDRLKEWLAAERGGIPYGDIAAALGTTEGAARVLVHRMRKRFRECFRQAVAGTVETEEEVEAELRHLAAVLSRA
jgi:RNA polymerase sigma-70 factor (ECF subfamily)